MIVHPHQKSLYQSEGDVHAYLHAKKQLHSTSFLRYFKEIANLPFWVIWACLVNTQYQFERTFYVYLQAKIRFHLSRFP